MIARAEKLGPLSGYNGRRHPRLPANRLLLAGEGAWTMAFVDYWMEGKDYRIGQINVLDRKNGKKWQIL